MKTSLATRIAVSTVLLALASPAFAAPPKHRAPVSNDTMGPYGQFPASRLLARPSDMVATEGHIVGADPDANIRTQLLHDPDPTGF